MLTLLCSFFLVASLVQCAPSSQIISGVEVRKGEFPYTVSLQRFNTTTSLWVHICGGTLIDFEYSITAATCLESSDATQYRIVAGLHELANTPEQQFLAALTIDIHPSFSNDLRNGFPNNIAVVRHQAAGFNNYVNSIPLPSSATFFNQFCNITGWGRYEGGDTAPVLRRGEDRIINDIDCNAAYSDVYINYNYHICFGDGQITACGVDHGGPLICAEPEGNQQAVVAGINSFNSINCFSGPSVYTRVSTYLSWICSITQTC